MPSSLQNPKEGIDFDSLGWNVNCSEHSKFVIARCKGGPDAKWGLEHYDPATDTGQILEPKSYEGLSNVFPSNTSLNYATTIWEGIKAFRTHTNDKCHIFRPEENYNRLAFGAKRMCLPVPPYEMFMRALQAVIQFNSDLIPPFGDGMKLYLRPILWASGQQLGLDSSPEYSFLVYCSPTGNYFKGKATVGLKLNIETKYLRAATGGTGNVKIAGNYGITMLPVKKAKAAGFNDNVHVDLESYHLALTKHNGDKKAAIRDSIVQEMSAANVFIVQKKHKRILTPSLERHTILPGVTRNSVVTLIKGFNKEISEAMGYSGTDSDTSIEVIERDVLVSELEDASECFATGTAAELVPIQSFTMPSADYEVKCEFGPEGMGPVASKILELIRAINYGKIEDKFKWNRDPFTSVEEFRAIKPPTDHYTPLIPESFEQCL